MINYFLYYAINSDNQLLISLYHQDIAAKVAFRLLSKEKNAPIRKTGELPQNIDDVNRIILAELFQIKQSLENSHTKVISKIIYTGDVNLGFPGDTIFPTSLFDGSIHQLFKNHPLFAKAQINIYLETHNTEIAQTASEIHLARYAKMHYEKYPNMPVIIRIKNSKTYFYTSPQYSIMNAQPPCDNQNQELCAGFPMSPSSSESTSGAKGKPNNYSFFPDFSRTLKYVGEFLNGKDSGSRPSQGKII